MLLTAATADEPGTPYSRRSDKSSSEPGDVELIERSIGGDGMHTGECGMSTVDERPKAMVVWPLGCQQRQEQLC